MTTFDRDPDSERAWKIAHGMAEAKTSTVLQDLLLGLNAHINYDLAYGTYLNLKQHGDEVNHLSLPRRKFDHDQVNNILVHSIPQIADTLTRHYGGGILLLRKTLRGLDIILTSTGLSSSEPLFTLRRANDDPGVRLLLRHINDPAAFITIWNRQLAD